MPLQYGDIKLAAVTASQIGLFHEAILRFFSIHYYKNSLRYVTDSTKTSEIGRAMAGKKIRIKITGLTSLNQI